ncbi:MAG: spore germination protein, partial [Alicyclobacillaceae bacterium]|nr:spore germination protein [Alicyclobacillaceae bacterium]
MFRRRRGRQGKRGTGFQRPRPMESKSAGTAKTPHAGRLKEKSAQEAGPGDRTPAQGEPVPGDFDRAVAWVQETVGESDDFVIRHFTVFGRFRAAVFFFSDLVDLNAVNKDILRPLMRRPPRPLEPDIQPEELVCILVRETIYHCETRTVGNLEKMV